MCMDSVLFADSKYELASIQNGGFLKIYQVDSNQDASTYTCIVRNRGGEEARREMELTVNSMWQTIWQNGAHTQQHIFFSFLFSYFHVLMSLLVVVHLSRTHFVAVWWWNCCFCRSGPPIIEPFAFPKNLQEGGRAQVTCAVSSGDMPVTFSWKKDDKPIPLGLQVRSSSVFQLKTKFYFAIKPTVSWRSFFPPFFDGDPPLHTDYREEWRVFYVARVQRYFSKT